MERLNCSKSEAEQYISDAISQAEAARNNTSRNTIISGSIGPYLGAPASCYNPSMILDL